MERTDAIVIGAGVVGLAIARALAAAGRSVVILEREGQFGTGTSSRNSEVIHAGIHYAHGSHRETLCIAGKRMLYDWCKTRNVPHKRLGKLTFAASAAERPRLEAIAAHALASGADPDLRWLDADEARAIEPALSAHAALLSPSSGIVDSHAFMVSLLGDAEDRSAMLARQAPAERIERHAGEWRVTSGDTTLTAAIVVNAAGHGAWDVAHAIEPLDPARIPPRFLAKGSYFTYSGRVPFAHLIYPLPIKGGLGTHLTLDMAGGARFGPDVEWLDAFDYAVDPAAKPRFLAAVRQFWPEIDPEHLEPGYSGIRPKLAGPGDPDADWLIEGPEAHGLPGLVNLLGIDSPGLTASLAIGEFVAGLVE
jgi:L-2-hydroxyglutarate oxidase LhgO